MPVSGARPPELPELLRVEDRISFLYLERCKVHRDSNAITAAGVNGVMHIPAAALGVMLLGPGTTVSHQAMVLAAESGATVVWVGEQGVRYYAHGRGLARTTRFLEAQARLCSSPRERLRVAREMYALRFPGEDVARLTMQQLRGREGARIRKVYRAESKRTGVPWSRREYDPEAFFDGDPVNQALSAAHSSLYGVVHSVIVGLGCSPGLGFVHTGHAKSFVYDIADLYKAEITIPLAFDTAIDPPLDIAGVVRRALRDQMFGGAFLSRCAKDIQRLLSAGTETSDFVDDDLDEVRLWDGGGDTVPSGAQYLERDDMAASER